MSARQEQQAELLERYLDALAKNPNAPPPQGLDSNMRELAQKMQARLAAPAPNPEFIVSLRKQLEQEAATLTRAWEREPQRRRFVALSRWSFVGIAAALLIALAAFFFYATRPPTANAQELLEHALSAATDLNGVKSFQMTQTQYNLIVDNPQAPPTRAARGEMKTWYAGPTRWRIEVTSEAPNQPPYQHISVSDGTAQWDYDPNENTVIVQAADPRNFPAPSVLSLDVLQQDMSNCYDPKVVGEDTIAGRATYKVYLGPAKCRSASAPELNGPHTIWLDKETFFVLKSEIRAVNSDQVTSSMEVTHIQYNLDLPNDLFQFAPPDNAKINDLRPKPAPSAQDYQSQLTALAQRAAFPLFAPSALPNDLFPSAPQYNEIDNQVELRYAPPGDTTVNTPADTKSISIIEKLADYESVRNWTRGAGAIDLNGVQAWVRRGDFNPNTNLGGNSAVLVLRDGTLISISSFTILPEQLIEVAKSLQPVPGSHVPLSNPTAPTLAEIRAQADFPFRIPTYVSEGLTPAPPTSHQVEYYRADGSLALIVGNAKSGEGGMEQEERFQGESVKLSNGVEAHQLAFEPQIIILWWDQAGGYTALEGHGIARDEMLKIAASMSSTAELGKTGTPPAPPTPTPVPAPAFTILRPTLLPENMKTTETNIPTPDMKGAGVQLLFDPHPNDPPHDVMTLTEFPKVFAETDINDPEMVKQDLGGRDVTIIKRGKGCVTYSWIQGEVALTLTNPYDPPGPPGAVRYTCEQMEKVIASIR